MLVDDIGDVTITNDGATILKLLEVEHPAAKILVELAELQDHEVGDGTTSVVIVACELLRRGNELVRQKVHPTSIISGFRMAMKEACRVIKKELALETSVLVQQNEESLLNAAKTSMSSKIIGADADFFAKMAVEAVKCVESRREDGSVHYPVSAINVLKAQGKNIRESRVLEGYALGMGRAAQGMPKSVQDVRIACLDMNLQKARMAMGVQVLVTDPAELERIRERESDITRERIQKILDAGANVVLTTKGIDDTCLKYFVEAGAIACRRVPRDDLRRVARMTGATIVSTLADEEGEESFGAELLGRAEEVYEDSIADSDVILIKTMKTTTQNTTSTTTTQRAATVLVRGANDYLLDEVDRSLHDAFCIVKRVLESGKLVPGGGAVEAALSVHLEQYARTLEGREQMAVLEFADALLVIPKTLAVNAAKDAIELVAQLRAKHFAGERAFGLDLVEGIVRDNVAAGVLEPMLSKVKIVQFATEAAVTILRIDDDIRLEEQEEE